MRSGTCLLRVLGNPARFQVERLPASKGSPANSSSLRADRVAWCLSNASFLLFGGQKSSQLLPGHGERMSPTYG